MDYKELRIGNWLKRESQPDGFQVDCNSFGICKQHPDWYEPIPLSEEWLIRFGFKEVIEKGNFELEFEGGVLNYNEYMTLCFGKYVEQSNKINCEFVHTLQNLYFALTGKELELN